MLGGSIVRWLDCFCFDWVQVIIDLIVLPSKFSSLPATPSHYAFLNAHYAKNTAVEGKVISHSEHSAYGALSAQQLNN